MGNFERKHVFSLRSPPALILVSICRCDFIFFNLGVWGIGNLHAVSWEAWLLVQKMLFDVTQPKSISLQFRPSESFLVLLVMNFSMPLLKLKQYASRLSKLSIKPSLQYHSN